MCIQWMLTPPLCIRGDGMQWRLGAVSDRVGRHVLGYSNATPTPVKAPDRVGMWFGYPWKTHAVAKHALEGSGGHIQKALTQMLKQERVESCWPC
jgi:hypothetical protein